MLDQTGHGINVSLFLSPGAVLRILTQLSLFIEALVFFFLRGYMCLCLLYSKHAFLHHWVVNPMVLCSLISESHLILLTMFFFFFFLETVISLNFSNEVVILPFTTPYFFSSLVPFLTLPNKKYFPKISHLLSTLCLLYIFFLNILLASHGHNSHLWNDFSSKSPPRSNPRFSPAPFHLHSLEIS